MEADAVASPPSGVALDRDRGNEAVLNSERGSRPVPTRRDTSQSLNIDNYYFSSQAGGASSSHSLSISASSSSSLGPMPSPGSLHSLAEESPREFETVGSTVAPESHLREESAMDPSGQTNRRIQVHQLASSSSSSLSITSPGISSGMSASSSYSDHSFIDNEKLASPISGAESYAGGFPFTQNDRDDQYHPHSKGPLASPGLISREDYDRNAVRASTVSTATQVEDYRHLERNERGNSASASTSRPQYSPAPHSTLTTPTQSSSSRFPDLQATPSFSRLAFVAPPDVSQRSLEALETEMDAAGLSPRTKSGQILRGGIDHPHDEDGSGNGSRSAPAWKTEFGQERSSSRRRESEEGSSLHGPTLADKGKNRQTLPAAASNAALVAALAETANSPPPKARLMARQTPSPQRSIDGEPVRRESRESQLRPDQGRLLSPSPEPPPRSSRREHDVRAGMSPDPTRSPAFGPGSPLVGPSVAMSPKSRSLPLAVGTTPLAASPTTSRTSTPSTPVHTSSVPPPQPRLVNSSTITDLSTLLGQAIDEIGLVNSKDLPPPDVLEPSKDAPRPNVEVPLRDGASSLDNSGPITPSTLPTRNASLPVSEYHSASSSTAMLPPALKPSQTHPSAAPVDYPPPVSRQYSDYSSRSQTVRKASSILSLRSNPNYTPVPFASAASRPWPAAMLFGHVKTLKTAGERAKGYAKGINELSRAETGLRAWCEAARRTPAKHRASSSIKSGYGSLTAVSANGARHPSSFIESSHSRQVSSQSEFPMRADSYTAREISVRHIDPANPPNGLPPNLPFPQLQQAQSGGMRASPSTQSMSSLSARKGFFSAIGRRGSGKKERESSILGPPQQRRDIRGLAISTPQGDVSRSSLMPGSLPTSRAQSAAPTPQGPRGSRTSNASETIPTTSGPQRHFNPANDYAGRGSLDASLARMGSSRSSFDSSTSRKLSTPITGSPLANEDDIKQMADVLPHVEQAVLRRYLARYRGQMEAIGAYLEDEKQGTVVRG